MAALFFQLMVTADTFIKSASEKEDATFRRLESLEEDMRRIEDLKAGLVQSEEENSRLRERHDFLKEAFDALAEEHDHVYDVVKQNLERVSERMKRDMRSK